MALIRWSERTAEQMFGDNQFYRLMKEMFATPKLIPNGADLDDYTTSGFYYCDSNTDISNVSNNPTGTDKYAFSLIVDGSGRVIRQIATTYHKTNPRTFVRMFNSWASPTWGDWFELARTDSYIPAMTLKQTITQGNITVKIYSDYHYVYVTVEGSISQNGNVNLNTTIDNAYRPQVDSIYELDGTGTAHKIILFANGNIRFTTGSGSDTLNAKMSCMYPMKGRLI